MRHNFNFNFDNMLANVFILLKIFIVRKNEHQIFSRFVIKIMLILTHFLSQNAA